MKHIFASSLGVRGLPAVWEGLRMISGLVAVVCLALMTLAVMIRESAEAQRYQPEAITAGRAAREGALTDHRQAGVQPPAPLTYVLYLAETEAQAQLADGGESRAQIPNRRYQVVPDEHSLRVSAERIWDEALVFGGSVLVEVVDLRDAY